MSDNVRLSYEKSLKDLERLVNGLRESFESMRIMEAKEVTESRLRFKALETRMTVLSRQVDSLKDKPMDELKLREIIGAEIKFQLSKIGRRIPLQGAIMTSEELRELLDLPSPADKGEFLNFLDSLKEQIEEDEDEEEEGTGELNEKGLLKFLTNSLSTPQSDTSLRLGKSAAKHFTERFKRNLEKKLEEEDKWEEDDNDGGCCCQGTPTSEEIAVYKKVKDYLEC